MGAYDTGAAAMNAIYRYRTGRLAVPYSDDSARTKTGLPSAYGLITIQSLCDAGYTPVLAEPSAAAISTAMSLYGDQESVIRFGSPTQVASRVRNSTEAIYIAHMLMSKPGAIPPTIRRAGGNTPAPVPIPTPGPAAPPTNLTAIAAAASKARAALDELDAAIASARR